MSLIFWSNAVFQCKKSLLLHTNPLLKYLKIRIFSKTLKKKKTSKLALENFTMRESHYDPLRNP